MFDILNVVYNFGCGLFVKEANCFHEMMLIIIKLQLSLSVQDLAYRSSVSAACLAPL
jgi:hypothetical protein